MVRGGGETGASAGVLPLTPVTPALRCPSCCRCAPPGPAVWWLWPLPALRWLCSLGCLPLLPSSSRLLLSRSVDHGNHCCRYWCFVAGVRRSARGGWRGLCRWRTRCGCAEAHPLWVGKGGARCATRGHNRLTPPPHNPLGGHRPQILKKTAHHVQGIPTAFLGAQSAIFSTAGPEISPMLGTDFAYYAPS